MHTYVRFSVSHHRASSMSFHNTHTHTICSCHKHIHTLPLFTNILPTPLFRMPTHTNSRIHTRILKHMQRQRHFGTYTKLQTDMLQTSRFGLRPLHVALLRARARNLFSHEHALSILSFSISFSLSRSFVLAFSCFSRSLARVRALSLSLKLARTYRQDQTRNLLSSSGTVWARMPRWRLA